MKAIILARSSSSGSVRVELTNRRFSEMSRKRGKKATHPPRRRSPGAHTATTVDPAVLVHKALDFAFKFRRDFIEPCDRQDIYLVIPAGAKF